MGGPPTFLRASSVLLLLMLGGDALALRGAAGLTSATSERHSAGHPQASARQTRRTFGRPGSPSRDANSVGGFQGASPFGIAITKDGQYAYLTFDLSEDVLKVRLSDFAVVGRTDLSAFFPSECENIALDVSEKKLFVYTSTWRKLLVIDTDTMSLSHTMDDYPLFGMVRSHFGARLMTWDGGGTIRFVDTDTLAVTQETLDNLFIGKIEEREDNQAKWYVVAQTVPGGQGPLTVGLFDHVAKSWDNSVTFSPQANGGVFALKALPNDNKAYVATFGGWYPGGGGYGWLYAVDLTLGQVKTIAIDGGSLCLAATASRHRLYVGTGWPIPNDTNLLVVDTQSDAILGSIPLGKTQYGWPHTQMNVLQVDPANPEALYATSADGTSFMKVRLDSLSLEREVIFNQEDVVAQSFAKRPTHDSGYIILRNRAIAIDLDSSRAVVNAVATLPVTPAWSYGAVVNSAGHLFINQDQQLLEADEADLSHAVAHTLPPDVPAMWGLRLSSNEQRLYSVVQPPAGGGRASVFVAINTTTFQVEARIPLADIPHAWRPYEVPDQAKVYVLGGEPNGPVTIDVIETTHHTLQKRITFDQPGLLGSSLSNADPFAYDPLSHTLFVGATYVVLAIDTRTDTIRQVIDLADSAGAIGLEASQLTYINAVGLVYSPKENYLYIAHLDRSYVSVYDLAGNRFLPQLIYVKGYFPTTMFANADVSRIYTLNDRSDNVTVINTATRTVENVLDLHDYVPVASPGAPLVTTQPSSRTIAAGTETVFTSTAISVRPTLPTPTVQWQVSTSNGVTWSNVAGATSTSYTFTPRTADDGNQYRAVFSSQVGTATSNSATLTVQSGSTRPTFLDDPLQRGLMPVKALHMVQLRHRIDELRTRYGLSAMTWTDDPIVGGVTVIKAVHLTELRSALTAVYRAASRTAPSFTNSSVVARATMITATHISELRAAVLAIW